jgi:hypothetical protein
MSSRRTVPLLSLTTPVPGVLSDDSRLPTANYRRPARPGYPLVQPDLRTPQAPIRDPRLNRRGRWQLLSDVRTDAPLGHLAP